MWDSRATGSSAGNGAAGAHNSNASQPPRSRADQSPKREGNALPPKDRNRALWSGFTIATVDGNIFFAGDTGWGGGAWAAAAAKHGPYRFAILPVGAYLPREVMASNHMNPEESVAAFQRLGAKSALGVHWGTFELTNEGVDEPATLLTATLRARGIPQARFRTLAAGAAWSVPLP